MLLLAGASFFTKAEVHISVSRKHKVSWADTEGKPGKNVFDAMYASQKTGISVIPNFCGASCGQWRQRHNRQTESSNPEKSASTPSPQRWKVSALL
jgi:hypothetical protein